MNIKEWLRNYNTINGYGTDDNSLLETLLEGERVFEEHVCHHRWYDSWYYIVQIEDKFIGYPWNIHTGDDNPYNDSFDWSDVHEMEPFENTIIDYRIKHEETE